MRVALAGVDPEITGRLSPQQDQREPMESGEDGLPLTPAEIEAGRVFDMGHAEFANAVLRGEADNPYAGGAPSHLF